MDTLKRNIINANMQLDAIEQGLRVKTERNKQYAEQLKEMYESVQSNMAKLNDVAMKRIQL